MAMTQGLRIGIVTCSDRCAKGEATDTAGPALSDLCSERGWEIAGHLLCADEPSDISAAIVQLAEDEECDVVFTVGGTGMGPRDVTPEATMSVADREVPGVAEAIRSLSMEVTRRAMLSRGVAAQRKRTLIVNLPGSEKAVVESFGFVSDQLEHAVDMMAGEGHG